MYACRSKRFSDVASFAIYCFRGRWISHLKFSCAWNVSRMVRRYAYLKYVVNFERSFAISQGKSKSSGNGDGKWFFCRASWEDFVVEGANSTSHVLSSPFPLESHPGIFANCSDPMLLVALAIHNENLKVSFRWTLMPEKTIAWRPLRWCFQTIWSHILAFGPSMSCVDSCVGHDFVECALSFEDIRSLCGSFCVR